MPIDRAPWNALVDDDGSNLVGTVWNKDKIKTVILDPTDAAIVSPWNAVPFNPADFTASSGTWTVAGASEYYAILNAKTALFQCNVSNTTLSASTVRMKIALPAAIQGNTTGTYFPFFYSASGIAGQTGLGAVVGLYLDLSRDVSGTPFPAGGGVYIYLTAMFSIP